MDTKKVNKTKLAKLTKDMQLRQLDHINQDMKCIETIGEITRYRRWKIKQQSCINYTNENDRLIGELAQTNVPYNVGRKNEQRIQSIKQAYTDSRLAMHILEP